MTSRTIQTAIKFSSPFLLPGFEEPQPAGDYEVSHDEELIDGYSWLAWRRVASSIRLPRIGATAATQHLVTISPGELETLILKDREP